MKRDIRINFGQLEDLCTTIANYRKELSDLQILSEELYQVLTAQTSNRLTELAEQWQERVIKKENQLENRLEAIQTLLSNYIYEMGNYIQPKDPDKLTQVDRNDIWWNLQQIVWEISSVYDPGGLAGTYYEPYNCEENDESVWKEDLWEGSVKQRQNREANYAKLRTFQTSFQNEILSQMQTDVWSIYDNHIVLYEETDDFYKEEALKYYLEYATFEDHCLDLYRREEDFGKGLNDQLKEIFEGLRVLSLFADETTRNAYINGELDEENTELMGNFIDGFREFFADPIGVLEAMGQKTTDRYEEEGLCYAAGYLSIDAGLTVCGGLKGLKSLTSLKFVDNATDTAQLAKHAENVVDAIEDAGDVGKIVENGNDVADSALDVGKVAEGGTSTSRPTWRQAELDAATDFPDYDAQKSFINGEEVPYGTKGSVRPDYYKDGFSVDIKNYNVESASGRSNLARNIEKQYYQRIENLPDGTKQSVMIDVRGQNISDAILDALYDDIMQRTNNGVEILFKMD